MIFCAPKHICALVCAPKLICVLIFSPKLVCALVCSPKLVYAFIRAQQIALWDNSINSDILDNYDTSELSYTTTLSYTMDTLLK